MKLNRAEIASLIVAAAFLLISAAYYIVAVFLRPSTPVSVEVSVSRSEILTGGNSPGGSAYLIDSPININSADSAELSRLPGIGDTLAQRIIDYRTENGRYAAVEDIMNVSGIGEATFEKIKSYIII